MIADSPKHRIYDGVKYRFRWCVTKDRESHESLKRNAARFRKAGIRARLVRSGPNTEMNIDAAHMDRAEAMFNWNLKGD